MSQARGKSRHQSKFSSLSRVDSKGYHKDRDSQSRHGSFISKRNRSSELDQVDDLPTSGHPSTVDLKFNDTKLRKTKTMPI